MYCKFIDRIYIVKVNFLQFAMAKDHEFILEQNQKIVQYRETVLASGGKITNRALTAWANVHFQVNAFEMNIGRIVKKKEHFSGLDVGHLGDSKCLRKSQCPEVEEATFTWFTTMQENNVALSDDLVVAVREKIPQQVLRLFLTILSCLEDGVIITLVSLIYTS